MSSTTRTLDVPGISCDHCKSAIEAEVGDVPGVEAVQVDVEAKTVAVTGGTEPDVVGAIERAGYEVA